MKQENKKIELDDIREEIDQIHEDFSNRLFDLDDSIFRIINESKIINCDKETCLWHKNNKCTRISIEIDENAVCVSYHDKTSTEKIKEMIKDCKEI